jgi:hypothetical protein
MCNAGIETELSTRRLLKRPAVGDDESGRNSIEPLHELSKSSYRIRTVKTMGCWAQTPLNTIPVRNVERATQADICCFTSGIEFLALNPEHQIGIRPDSIYIASHLCTGINKGSKHVRLRCYYLRDSYQWKDHAVAMLVTEMSSKCVSIEVFQRLHPHLL